MSKELTVFTGFQFTKGNVTLTLPTINKQIDVAGTHIDYHVQNIGTTEEALTISSDIVTPGMIYLYNTDGTNFVQFGTKPSGTFNSTGRLRAGDPPAEFCYDGQTIYLKANTAPCDVIVVVIEA